MSVLSLLSDLMDTQVPQMKNRPNEDKKLILSSNLYKGLIEELEAKSGEKFDPTDTLHYHRILVEEFGTTNNVYASIQLK